MKHQESAKLRSTEVKRQDLLGINTQSSDTTIYKRFIGIIIKHAVIILYYCTLWIASGDSISK